MSFKNIKDWDLAKTNYLRADLLVIERLPKVDIAILNQLVGMIHEAGSLLILSGSIDPTLLKKTGLKSTKVPGLFTKGEGYTPKEYGVSYIERWGDTDFMKNWKLMADLILAHMPRSFTRETVRVFDVGCLNAYMMESLRRVGVKHIYGTDISYEIGINRIVDPYHLPAVTIEDFNDNSYPDHFGDIVICMEVLEHLPPETTDKFIEELKRVTSDNGVILISTSEDPTVDPTHTNCRPRAEWFKIFAKHNLVPVGEQIVFPGFNSFVIKKATGPLAKTYSQSVQALSAVIPLWGGVRALKRAYRRGLRFRETLKRPYRPSYAQSGEDIIVRYLFDALGIKKPSYIDIGAHHPTYISNTALLYQTGSRGINIEPDPSLFREFINSRPLDTNLNIGLAKKPGQLDFFLMDPPALNTFSKEEAQQCVREGSQIVSTRKVSVQTLPTIIDKYCHGIFPDFMSLDVEGLDMEILQTIEFEKTAPLVICVETISYSARFGEGRKETEIIDFLLAHGYQVYADTHLNTIFLKKNFTRL
jgi:FkbM family methyltransferase